MTAYKITAVSDKGTEFHTVFDVYDAVMTATKLGVSGASVTVTQEPDRVQDGLDACVAKLNARS